MGLALCDSIARSIRRLCHLRHCTADLPQVHGPDVPLLLRSGREDFRARSKGGQLKLHHDSGSDHHFASAKIREPVTGGALTSRSIRGGAHAACR